MASNSDNFFDFSNADDQREFSGEPIPGGTIALFKVNIRRPKPEQALPMPTGPQATPDAITSAAMVTRSKTSAFQYLDCEFECVSGTLKGRKFWQNMGVGGDGSDGHTKAINITRATFKAMLQAARNVAPGDNSPVAQAALIIKGFHDLEGLTIPIKIGYDTPSTQYPKARNVIRAVVTPDKQEYGAVMAGGEVLGSEPAPSVTAAASAAPATTGGWAAPGTAAPAAASPGWSPAGAPPAGAAPVPPAAQGGLPGASVPQWAR
ncbi:MAG: hypothetical protein CVU73_10990 [Deltaproteobacteria bacterium HGW-Deltaproteobacteria-8]|jgi:hypothetical protein|nr:MAG: hypothetical protein CVU73_10990 [Deltaproteobacteria bacterium HGW-Deltaproteobacteria-8]